MAVNPEAFPKTRTLPKCSEEQAKEYFAQAKVFIKATDFYNDVRSCAEAAVAEYIAFQEGYTVRDWK